MCFCLKQWEQTSYLHRLERWWADLPSGKIWANLTLTDAHIKFTHTCWSVITLCGHLGSTLGIDHQVWDRGILKHASKPSDPLWLYTAGPLLYISTTSKYCDAAWGPSPLPIHSATAPASHGHIHPDIWRAPQTTEAAQSLQTRIS